MITAVGNPKATDAIWGLVGEEVERQEALEKRLGASPQAEHIAKLRQAVNEHSTALLASLAQDDTYAYREAVDNYLGFLT